MADAQDLGSCGRKAVRVQVPPFAIGKFALNFRPFAHKPRHGDGGCAESEYPNSVPRKGHLVPFQRPYTFPILPKLAIPPVFAG